METLIKTVICSISILLLPLVDSKWTLHCPQECNCTMMTTGKWILDFASNWPDSAKEIKSVVCNVQSDSILTQLLGKIPQDTQCLTLIQKPSSKQMTISDKHMRQLPQLLGLDLQGSKMSKRIFLSSEWLRSQPKLQYLRLWRVNATAFDSLTFSKLKGLKIIHLVDVGFRSIPTDLFLGLTSLTEISLNDNDVEKLPPNILSTLPNLKILSVSRNRLRCYDNCTGDFPLSRLQHLDLTGNQIGHISTFTFMPMISLTALHLNDNPIQVIFPNAFQSTPNIQTLTLGHKKQSIHLMPFSFAGLNKLTSLTVPNADNNVLEYGMFAGLSSLAHLNIIESRVQQITTNAFIGAPNLQTLVIRECRLKRLYRDAFGGLKYLTNLDLSRNRLSKLNPSAFYGLKRLRDLSLQNNQLESLPKRFFHIIPTSLGSLRLDGNPWNCTCEAGKWKSAAIGKVRKDTHNSGSVYVKDKSVTPLCHVPHQFNGKPVMDVLKKQLKCFKKKRDNI